MKRRINRTITYIMAVFVLFFTAVSLLSGENVVSPRKTIRIGIIENAGSVNISCEGGFSVRDEKNNREMKLDSRKVYLVSARAGGIGINNKILGGSIRIYSLNDKNRLRVNGRKYRGDLRIALKRGKKLTVINKLGLEEYLYGVLPREISPEWPVEAMKTQAVVSRTYAARNMGKHNSKGYDLSATVFCQVYGGLQCEDERSNKAVDATEGEVIYYKGELISAVFHSTCGGFTEKSSNVWETNSSPGYLKCVRCPYCRKSPRYSWKKTIKKETIRKKLNKSGYKVGRIHKIKVAGRASFSKRAININVYHDAGKLSIPSNKFRIAVGADIVKSTMVKLKNYPDEIKYVGRGWGHGVGLCQWGAKGMAERGYKYLKIIRKYFPGTKINK